MSPLSSRKRPSLPGLVTAILVIVILYFGKPVLMPLALAALFAFLLNPLVNALQRWRLPRALAVVLVTLSVFSFLGIMGWVIGREFSSLATSLPNYKDNIRHRIISFHRSGRGGVMEKLQDIQETIKESSAAAASALPEPAAPTASGPPVPSAQKPASAPDPTPAVKPTAAAAEPTIDRPIPTVEEAEQSPGWLNGVLGTAGEGLGNAATVIVFVIFMLLRQQELRNRLMRLAGFRHVTNVTRAMDETGGRVGRYLLMQAIINGLYGTTLAIGLYFIGLPYIVLWGVLADLFRFIPYVGPAVVALLPSALALAVFPDWQHPLMVMGFIALLELVTNMVLEPVLYGQNVGVSEFALLVAIVFWTWLWGGIGLIMATPLTVCFVVMAKHVPSLDWVDILMGENPKVKSYMIFYQRLLAGDEIEAGDFLRAELKKKSAIDVLDDTILPAIALAKRESSQERLSDREEKDLHDSVLRVLTHALPDEMLVDAASPAAFPSPADNGQEPPAPVPAAVPAPPRLLILGWPLDGPADEAALRCLSRHLPQGFDFEIVPGQRLTGELHAEIETRQPAALLISATPPGSHETARLQLRRLRRQFPRLRIYIGRWGVTDDIAKAAPLLEAGATGVYTHMAAAEAGLAMLLRETAAVDLRATSLPI